MLAMTSWSGGVSIGWVRVKNLSKFSAALPHCEAQRHEGYELLELKQKRKTQPGGKTIVLSSLLDVKCSAVWSNVCQTYCLTNIHKYTYINILRCTVQVSASAACFYTWYCAGWTQSYSSVCRVYEHNKTLTSISTVPCESMTSPVFSSTSLFTS